MVWAKYGKFAPWPAVITKCLGGSGPSCRQCKQQPCRKFPVCNNLEMSHVEQDEAQTVSTGWDRAEVDFFPDKSQGFGTVPVANLSEWKAGCDMYDIDKDEQPDGLQWAVAAASDHWHQQQAQAGDETVKQRPVRTKSLQKDPATIPVEQRDITCCRFGCSVVIYYHNVLGSTQGAFTRGTSGGESSSHNDKEHNSRRGAKRHRPISSNPPLKYPTLMEHHANRPKIVSKISKKNPTSSYGSRYWNPSEHQLFLQAIEEYGRGNWTQISESIPTKTADQVRSHAQKHQTAIEQGTAFYRSPATGGGRGGDFTKRPRKDPATIPAKQRDITCCRFGRSVVIYYPTITMF